MVNVPRACKLVKQSFRVVNQQSEKYSKFTFMRWNYTAGRVVSL